MPASETKDPKQRITLVTGASRGIGHAAVLHLVEHGHHVIAVARSEEALKALDDQVRERYEQALTLIPLDLKDSTSIDALAPALLERFGRLDGLLANAGMLGTLGPLQQVSPFEFDAVIDVNLKANWRLIRALDPLLRVSASGRAVFMTSGITKSLQAYWGPYAASKAALEAMISCYADEVKSTNLRVSLFDPGATATQMRNQAMPGEDPASLPSPQTVALALIPLLEATHIDNGNRICFSGA